MSTRTGKLTLRTSPAASSTLALVSPSAVYQSATRAELHGLRVVQIVVERDRELDLVAARELGGEVHVGEEVLKHRDARLAAAELAVGGVRQRRDAPLR